MRLLRVGSWVLLVLGAVVVSLAAVWATPDEAPRRVVFLGGPIITMAEPLVV